MTVGNGLRCAAMVHRRRARPVVSLAVVLACVGGTMLLGSALKGPCLTGGWGDVRQYRLLCYSDIVPLLGTEQLQGNRIPYLDRCAPTQNQCDEYPALTMAFMRVAGWISGSDSGRFFVANSLLLLGCALVAAACLFIMVGSRALYLALSPTLLIYGTMNWDLFAMALATVGMLAFFRRRDGAAGAWIGLGAAAKLYPALLVIPLIADRLRRASPDRAIILAWSSAGTWLAVNLPLILLAPAAWFTFFRFNADRAADWDSLWYIACRHAEPLCLPVRTVNAASLVLFVATFALVWWLRARREPGFSRWTLGFPMLVLFLLTNKVYSPQYGLWLLPWFALALPGLRRFVVFQIADVAVFVTRFWFFGWMQGVFGVPQGYFEVAVLARAAILTWCLIAWVRAPVEPIPIERQDWDVAEPEVVAAA